MSILERVSTIVRAKVNEVLDQREDPSEALETSYEKQLRMLQEVRRGLADIVTSRRRIELQAAQLRENQEKLQAEAKKALEARREDLATLALQRKQQIGQQLEGLEQQVKDLQAQQDKITEAEQRLAAKVEAFRTKKEVIKAQYSAAEASVKIGEAATGVSEEMADVGLAIQRAEDKTKNLQARASAIDELVAAGTLEDYTGSQDEVERELQKLSASQGVSQELEELKKQVESEKPGAGSAR